MFNSKNSVMKERGSGRNANKVINILEFRGSGR